MSDYLAPLLVAWGIQWMGILAPGPSVGLILGVATTGGRRAALVTCAGIGAGSLVLAVVTVAGVSAVFAEIAWAITALKVLGAGYLLWLAWGALRRAARPAPPLRGVQRAPALSRAGLAGFLMQATNPKAMGFWLAIAALGGLAGAPAVVLALFVAGAFVNSFLGHAAWAVLLSSVPFVTVYARLRRAIDASLGALFGAAAIGLLTART